MAIRITHAQNSESFVAKYRYYRATSKTGTYASAGEVQQPASAEDLVTFDDADGTLGHWYKITAVTIDDTESLATDAFQPDQQASQTQVWDVLRDAAGNPLVNQTVEFRLTAMATFNGVVIPQVVRVVTNQYGHFVVNLYANALLSPDTTYYFVALPNVDTAKKVRVPQQLAARFSDILLA